MRVLSAGSPRPRARRFPECARGGSRVNGRRQTGAGCVADVDRHHEAAVGREVARAREPSRTGAEPSVLREGRVFRAAALAALVEEHGVALRADPDHGGEVEPGQVAVLVLRRTAEHDLRTKGRALEQHPPVGRRVVQHEASAAREHHPHRAVEREAAQRVVGPGLRGREVDLAAARRPGDPVEAPPLGARGDAAAVAVDHDHEPAVVVEHRMLGVGDVAPVGRDRSRPSRAGVSAST
jgi:hypothetical protein